MLSVICLNKVKVLGDLVDAVELFEFEEDFQLVLLFDYEVLNSPAFLVLFVELDFGETGHVLGVVVAVSLADVLVLLRHSVPFYAVVLARFSLVYMRHWGCAFTGTVYTRSYKYFSTFWGWKSSKSVIRYYFKSM